MISKELLSEVLNKPMNPLRGEPQHICNDIFYGTDDDVPHRINIYELAHKCREWAVDNGYVLEIIPFCVTVINLKTLERKVFRYNEEDMLNQKPYLPKYEIMACEWTKDNK